ncbi:MAG: tetratricopeptide repeat protein [Gracilimonas sp.]|nr:tetratricopeptide repeat protein [Gracilimonas sp.]
MEHKDSTIEVSIDVDRINADKEKSDEALEVKPDDYHGALNNIGVQLFESGRKEEALEYLNKAMEANPEYPNTLFAFAMIADLTLSHAQFRCLFKPFKFTLFCRNQ